MEKVYYSIAEVADMFAVKPSLLRYWEKEFPQLKPKRNDKGTRFYTTADIDVIKQIRYLLSEQKLTIAGAQARLKNNKDAIERNSKIREKLQAMRQELLAIRRELNQNDAFGEEVIIK
ncbi:MAG: MerR family transcriptional regulator [Paludibacteraceae bacterium]